MRKINIILILLTCISAFGQIEQNKVIKFDGLYETKCEFDKNDTEGTQKFLRFYPNEKVISVPTDCDLTADDLKDWFNMDMNYLSVDRKSVV